MSALTNWRLKTKRLYIKKRVFITLQTMASPSPFWGCGVVLLQFSLSAVDASNLLDYDRMVIGLSILFGSNPLHHSSKSHPTHPHDSFYGSESATWSVQTSHTELKDRFLFFYFFENSKGPISWPSLPPIQPTGNLYWTLLQLTLAAVMPSYLPIRPWAPSL